MWGKYQNGVDRPAYTGLLAVFLTLCVLVLALHVHEISSPSSDVHCAACATLHGVASCLALSFVIQFIAALLAPRRASVMYTSHQPSSNLLVRPPPSV